MIQDIYPDTFSLEYKHIDIKDDDIVIVGNLDKEILLIDNDLPRYRQLKDELDNNYQFLFSISNENYFMYNGTIKNRELIKTRQAIRILDSSHNFGAATGYHLYNWYLTHRYCGRCGHEMIPDEEERALYCENCKQIYYPNIAVAIIVAIIDNDRILMSRYSNRDYKGNALIAGFCEIGETPEQTCIREVQEEVGIKIKDIEYFASQPWGIDGNLLLGYFARLDGDATLRVDHKELSSAMWVNKKDIEANDNPISLTATLIEQFRKS